MFWLRLQASYIKKAKNMGLALDEAFILSQIWKNTKKLKMKYNSELMKKVLKYCPQNLITFDIEILNNIFGK